MPQDDLSDAAMTVGNLASGTADRGAGSAGDLADLRVTAAGSEQKQQLEALLDGAQLVGRANILKKGAAFIGALEFENGFVKGIAAVVVQFLLHGVYGLLYLAQAGKSLYNHDNAGTGRKQMLFPGKGVLQVAIRMVGLDLDGTLFNSKKELTAHTCAVLAAAARKGVAVVPATGRPRIGLPQALLAIPGIRYAVVSNGAAVCDLCTGERLYTDCMPLDAAVDILRRTRTLEVVQGAFIGDWGYMEEIGRQRIRALDLVAAMQEDLISSRKIVPDLPAYVAQRGEAPEKVVINLLKTPDGKARFREETVAVVRQYPEVSFVSGGVGNIEIIHKSAGKGSALLKLGELLGIGRTEIMAVGDSENDLDMIEKAGLGVAMANGEEIVKAHADVLTGSNDDDGAAAAVEAYVLDMR